MITKGLYSVRMRASAGQSHLSGAERLVPRSRIDATVSELIRRAWAKQRAPEQVSVSIDFIGDALFRTLPSLELISLNISDLDTCRKKASQVLEASGVSAPAVRAAFHALENGAAPGGVNMRGAMLIDADTGKRLEADHARGVRVSRFDWSDEASARIDQELSLLGLTHFRTKEALALATKVADAPGIVAELCWSDDPDYTAGYAASRSSGYVRFPAMKPPGSVLGGRAFFVRLAGTASEELLTYLQETPVLITGIGICRVEKDLPGGTG